MATYKAVASVDVRGKATTIGEVWDAFWKRFERAGRPQRSQWEQDGTPSVFSFTTEALAMNFARRCLAAGLRARVYPIMHHRD